MLKESHSLIAKLQKNKILIWFLILTITILWGYAWVLMKEALAYMGPFTFSSFRFGVGSITLVLIVLLSKKGLPPKRYWRQLVILGILQTSIVFLLVMYGLRFVDAGKSSVLLYSMPMWSSILAVKFLDEKFTPAKFLGLFIGMIGLLTVLGWDIWVGQSFDVIFGEILIIIAAISWGVSNIFYRVNLNGLSQLQVNAYQMLFGTIGIIAVTLFAEWGQPVQLNMHSIYYILFTGVLASALCFTVWFLILSIIDMVSATLSTLLVPIFGLVLSSFILGETMSAGVVAGSGLIIIGIVVSQISKKHPRRI
ncbi:DMT family transporter [Virgibacillus oceani]|uniref:Transporter YoaV n=1 Tax=Virgibacillus oceani TaxID=1479511 RepID=A0A917LYS7_9BACI|nr:DMT family transporter [Virgibacillus oceani]GGG67715.1 putative transporter YoaV [Virgibacillus oceani]